MRVYSRLNGKPLEEYICVWSLYKRVLEQQETSGAHGCSLLPMAIFVVEATRTPMAVYFNHVRVCVLNF